MKLQSLSGFTAIAETFDIKIIAPISNTKFFITDTLSTIRVPKKRDKLAKKSKDDFGFCYCNYTHIFFHSKSCFSIQLFFLISYNDIHHKKLYASKAFLAGISCSNFYRIKFETLTERREANQIADSRLKTPEQLRKEVKRTFPSVERERLQNGNIRDFFYIGIKEIK